MGEDADALAGVARLHDGGAGAVGVDQAVAVVRVGDARERVGADDHGPLDVAGADHGVAHDHSLQPAGAAEDHVDRDGPRILDLQLCLHARRQRRHHVGAAAVRLDVAEVMAEDDVVERLGIDP